MTVENLQAVVAGSPNSDSRSRGRVRVLHNFVALAFAQLATWAGTAVTVALLPRYLGAGDLGKFSIAFTSLIFLGLLTDLGVNTYLTKQIPRSTQSTAQELVWSALGLRVPLILLASAVGIAVFNIFIDNAETRMIFYIVLPYLAMQAISGVLAAALQGSQNMRPLAFSSTLTAIIGTILVVAVLQLDLGVQAVAAVYSVGAIIGVAIPLRAVVKHFGLNWPDTSKWRSMVSGGLPFFVWTSALAVYGLIDIFILAKLTSSEVVGWYSAAYRIIGIPVFIPTLAMSALFPALSAASVNNREEMYVMTRKGLQFVLAATIPMSIGIAVLPDRIIDSLGYQAEFHNSVPLMAILALHIPLAAAGMIIGSALYAMDTSWRWVRFGILAALLNPIGNFILIPLTDHLYNNGAIGASIATVCTELFMVCGAIYLLPRGVLGKSQIAHLGRCALGIAGMVAVVTPIRDLPLLAVILAGAATYGLLMIPLKIFELSDMKWIMSTFAAKLRPERADS